MVLFETYCKYTLNETQKGLLDDINGYIIEKCILFINVSTYKQFAYENIKDAVEKERDDVEKLINDYYSACVEIESIQLLLFGLNEMKQQLSSIGEHHDMLKPIFGEQIFALSPDDDKEKVISDLSEQIVYTIRKEVIAFCEEGIKELNKNKARASMRP